MKLKPPHTTFLFCLCLLASQLARADVVFDTFGPNNGYDSNRFAGITWNVLSPGFSANAANGVAVGFLVGNQNYSLSSVTLALGYLQGTNNLAISVVADNGGAPTGDLLERIALHPTNPSNLYEVVTYGSSLNPVMAGGTRYWLIVAPMDRNTINASNNSAYAWSLGPALGDFGFRTFNFSTSDWANWQLRNNSPLPAFRIEGAPIPEPSALLLVLAGGAAFLALHTRKKLRKERP